MRNQGAGRHRLADRGHDLYETPAEATRALIRNFPLPRRIWEPAAGRGAIKRVLEESGYEVNASDLVAYEGADDGILGGVNFFDEIVAPSTDCALVTNPPYGRADDFIRHGLSFGIPVIVLLRLAALEGAKRSDLIDEHLTEILVGIERLPFMHRDGWAGPKNASSGAPFAWFVFTPKKTRPTILRRISWRAS